MALTDPFESFEPFESLAADWHRPAEDRLDGVAWQFLRSEFAGAVYLSWTIDRRLDRFLSRRGHHRLHKDGSAYEALLNRVMANIGAAMEAGVLAPASARTSP